MSEESLEKPQIAKTPEELLAEKKSAFEEHPEMFLDKRKVVACAVMKPDGSVGIVINRVAKSLLFMAKAKLNHYIEQGICMTEVKEAQDNKSRIVKPSIKNRFKGAFGKGG